MSWSLMWFHIMILIVTLFRNKFAAMIHDGFWTLKALIVLGIFIGSCWIPNDPTMNGYMTFAKWVSVIYLSYQAILILAFAYVINDALVDNMNDDATNCSGIILIVVFLCFLGGSITWTVF